MHSLLLVVAFSLPAAGLLAQEPSVVFLPVDDLLAPRPDEDPYLSTVGMEGRRWLRGEEAWLSGEGRLRQRPQPWFDGVSLRGLLGQLTGREGDLWLLPDQRTLAVRRQVAEPVRAALAELRQRLLPSVRCELQVLRAGERGDEVLLARAVDCAPGNVRVVSAIRDANMLADYEVEIAQGAAIANPVTLGARSGAMVVLRPWLPPGASEALVEVLVRVVEPQAGEAIDLGHPGFGGVDRIAVAVHETAGVVRAKIGQRLEQRWSGAGGVDYALRFALQWNPPAPVRPIGHELEHAAWCDRLEGFRSQADAVEDGDEDEAGGRWLDGIAEGAELALLRPCDRGGARIALDAAAESLRLLLAARLAAMPAGAAFELQVVDAPAGAGFAAGGELPEGARRLGRMRLQVVPGTWVCATAYDEGSVLYDWDTEVAQSSRIGDPKLVRLQHGLVVNARLAEGVLEVDGEWSWREPDVVQEMSISAPVHTPELVNAHRSGEQAIAEKMPAVLLPADKVRLEKPVRVRVPFAARLPLRQGAAMVGRQAAASLGQGRELLLVARAVE